MIAQRILLVEDEPIIAGLLAELLAALGYEVCGVEATEGGAIAAATSSRPDLIIVDAGLRDGSGISAIESIMATTYIPHLFISGDPGRVRARRPGAAILAKPFREAELVRAIKRVLASSAPA